jgi:hypothetical protein
MPFSSGTFSRVHDFTDDRDNGIRIQASRMDAEMDGIATGLSTALLKDGTQTATATIPFAAGISIIDNQKITLGTNSDITLQYDETTNDSLEIAANVEGAALGIVLKSDQGDDNADQHKLSIADGGVLTLGSKISGSFVSYLTHTPNSTVASSTLAVAGNLTVGGNLTLGSGAELSEAELEMLDGITAGTVTASKAVVVDANKDIASFRNITLTGELDAGSLDVSGDADIDGTLEADAMTLNGSAITTVATLSTGISNGNLPVFTSGVADDDFLRVNGTAIEGRSASEVLSDIGGQAALTFGISNTNIPIFTSGVVDDDFLRVNGTSIEGRSASEVLSDIGASAVAGSSSIVTTGALDSGSITSGFGNINNGTSTLTTGNTDINGTVAISGDTTLEDGADLITASAGTSNVRIGVNAGNSIASGGNYNVVVGDEAGTALTTGDNNVAIGYTALDAEDAGSGNIAIGYRALSAQDGADNNLAIGTDAGLSITSGGLNTLIGSYSGDALTLGQANVAVGYATLTTDVRGSNSTALGYGALQNQTFSSATDVYNTAVGFKAGRDITTGLRNTLIGALAGDALTDADSNIALGTNSLTADTLGSKSIAIGQGALFAQNFTSATDTHNIAVGHETGLSITTGIQNTLIGGLAGDALTDADYNVAIGKGALSADTQGSKSTAVGVGALESQNFTSATDTQNTAVGLNAGNAVTTANRSTFVGHRSGQSVTTQFGNAFFGNDSGINSTGQLGTFIGDNAGQNSTGNSNTLIGQQAGYLITSGGNNTVIGRYDGNQGGLDIRSSSNQIVISDGDGNPRISINNSGFSTLSNDRSASSDRLGSASAHVIHSASSGNIMTFVENVSSDPRGMMFDFSKAAPDNNSNFFMKFEDSSAERAFIYSDGDMYNHDGTFAQISDTRIKDNITDANSQWNDIKAMRFVNYQRKDDIRQYGADKAKVQLGVLSQELEKVSPNLVREVEPNAGDILCSSEFGSLYEDGDTIPEGSQIGDVKEIKDKVKGVAYSILYMKSVKALQEAIARIETLESKVTALEGA